jgi:hypothetical protein
VKNQETDQGQTEVKDSMEEMPQQTRDRIKEELKRQNHRMEPKHKSIKASLKFLEQAIHNSE